MNMYEYAMQMEKDGATYYRDLAGNCQTEGIRAILTMLGDEEVKHFNIIAQLQKNAGNSALSETKILENVKNVFAGMKDEKADMRFDSSELEAYRKATLIEKASQNFYLDQASKTVEDEVKQLFLRLADEEEKHCRIMENITEFVSRPEPGNWLENAEWHHLDEY